MSPYNYRWRKARLRFLSAHPTCRMCEARSLTAAASVVDHIVPHKGDQTLFWDERNWQPACKPCHDSRKAMLERGDKVMPHASWGDDTGGGITGRRNDVLASASAHLRGISLTEREVLGGNTR